MATRAQVQSAAEDLRATLGPIIQSRQDAFFAARGRYWQGIRTHAALPVDGVDAAPDPDAHPTDQPETWADVGITLPAACAFSLEIHAYDGPGGHGYVVIATFRYGGNTWSRTWNVGPEPYRAALWDSRPTAQV